MAFLDTSVLGSYYCRETLSAAVNQALASLPEAVISPLVEAEFMSLVSLKVRTGSLDRAAADQTRRLFLRHKSAGLFRMVAMEDAIVAVAARWLGRFNTPLRTVDALHLATAHSHRLQIWTTDKGMAASAQTLRVPFKLIS